MNERIKKLTEEAAKLSPADRAELVDGILASLAKTDPEIDRAWAEVCGQRLQAYERGEIAAVDFDEVMEISHPRSETMTVRLLSPSSGKSLNSQLLRSYDIHPHHN